MLSIVQKLPEIFWSVVVRLQQQFQSDGRGRFFAWIAVFELIRLHVRHRLWTAILAGSHHGERESALHGPEWLSTDFRAGPPDDHRAFVPSTAGRSLLLQSHPGGALSGRSQRMPEFRVPVERLLLHRSVKKYSTDVGCFFLLFWFFGLMNSYLTSSLVCHLIVIMIWHVVSSLWDRLFNLQIRFLRFFILFLVKVIHK